MTKSKWLTSNNVAIFALFVCGSYQLAHGNTAGLIALGGILCLIPDQFHTTDKRSLFRLELIFGSLGVILMILGVTNPAFISQLLPGN